MKRLFQYIFSGCYLWCFLQCFPSSIGYAQEKEGRKKPLAILKDSLKRCKETSPEIYAQVLEHFYQQSVRESEQSFRLEALYWKAELHYEQGLADSALQYLDQMPPLADALNESEMLIKFWYLRGYVFKNIIGNQDSAYFFFNRCLEVSRLYQNSNYESAALQSLSFLLMDRGDYVQAIDFLFRAREIAYQLPDTTLVPRIMANVGHVYLQMGMYEEALTLLDEIHQKYDFSIGINTLNLSFCYQKLGDYEKALFFLNHGKAHLEDKNLQAQSKYYLQLTGLYLDMGAANRALSVLKKVPLFSERIRLKATSYEATAYLLLGDTLQAHRINKVLLPKISGEKTFDLLLQTHRSLAQTYSYIGNFEESNRHYQTYLNLHEQTYTPELRKKLYQDEVKQHLLLQQKTYELSKLRLEEKIKEENQEKIYLFALILVVITIAAGLYKLYRITNRHRQELEQKNTQLIKAQKEIKTQHEKMQCQAKELHELNTDLERLVAQRTQEITQKNKALEEYAFINAHRLRSPVARILGILHLLDLTPNYAAEAREYFGILRQEVHELDEVITTIKHAIANKKTLDRDELDAH